jgi:uridine phosphorylase
MEVEREYHIGIAKGEIPEAVLLPGDPGRALKISEKYFDDPEEIAKNREYWSYKGYYDGTPVAVCSTGIGCPSAAIAMEELINVGCKTFIRVGTAGAIGPTLQAGDIVIFSGSVREDGTSKQYIPVQFPAIATPSLVLKLIEAARSRNVRYEVGIGHSKDAFYSEHPDYMADPDAAEKKWAAFKKTNVIATEMESSVLFIIGQLREVEVATACVIIGEHVDKQAKIVGKPPLDNLIRIALDALVASHR